jgi:sulfite exporter TauE/SafE
VAFIPWFISIILRGPSWILLSRDTKKILYFITGILVIILGLLSIAFTFLSIGAYEKQRLSALQLPVLLWGIYSFFEFLSYISIKLRFFRIASINIISIILINLAIALPEPIREAVGLFVIIGAFIIMVISAIFAAIGFFKFTAEKAKPEIKYTIPPPPY